MSTHVPPERAGRTRRRRWWVAGVVAVLAVVGGTVALLLRPAPTLLPAGSFPTATQTLQNDDLALAPGWTWCTDLSPGVYLRGRVIGSWFGVPDGAVGATIVDRRSDGMIADVLIDRMEQDAALCAQTAGEHPDNHQSIEPLTGLGDGAVGWRTRDLDVRGEYVVIPLPDGRLLAVGSTTTADDAPIDVRDLLALAAQGAEQFPATD